MIVCKRHMMTELGGEPIVTKADDGLWELDLSEMYCPKEPSDHPDIPQEFEIYVKLGGMAGSFRV